SIVRRRIDAVDVMSMTVPSPIPDRTTLFPVLSAHLDHRSSIHRPEVSRLEIDARLGPMLDIRFCWFDPRIYVSVRDVTWYKKTEIRGTVEFAQTVPPDEALSTTFVQGALEALYPLGRRISVGGGGRLAWQRLSAQATKEVDTFFTTVFYGTVVYHEPTIHLRGGNT